MYCSTTPMESTISQCFVPQRTRGFHADRGRQPQEMHLMRVQATASFAAVADVFYAKWFISVWCFLAAWSTVLICFHFVAQRTNTVPRSLKSN